MTEAFSGFFAFFGVTSDETGQILMIFIASGAAVLLLRFCLFARYIARLASARRDFRKAEGRDEALRATKNRWLSKLIREYLDFGDRGLVSVSARDIVLKRVNRLRLMGLDALGLDRFLGAFNLAFLVSAALVLPVISEKPGFIVIVLIVFAVSALASLFVSVESAKNALIDGVSDFIEREFGKFFARDYLSSVLMFKSETMDMLAKQTEVLAASIASFEKTTAEAVGQSVGALSKSLYDSVSRVLEDLAAVASGLAEPALEWRESIEAARETQTDYNEKMDGLKAALSDIEETARGLAPKLGDGIGGIIEMKMREGYQGFVDELGDSIRKISQSNNMLALHIEELAKR